MKRIFVLLFLMGCGGNPPPAESGYEDTPAPMATSLTTSDGVHLVGDYYAAETLGPAVLLLHMSPPDNDRSNFPPAFIRGLHERGLPVLNLDRRGAGESGGNARDAYEGPGGALDVAAALDFLAREPGIERDHIVIVGASNGTTSAIDYTIANAADAQAIHPRALVFLTPGEYTEKQNEVRGNAVLAALPILFVYSRAEREFSAALNEGAPPRWEFFEYAHGDHGTRMFAAERSSITRVADWVAQAAN